MLLGQELKEFVQERLGDHLFVIVSNRQPYEHIYRNGRIEAQRPSGGVVTALDPVMQACHGLWIASSSGEADHRVTDRFNRVRVPPGDPSYTLKRVKLTKQEEDGYYNGYANDALWPLCHTAFQRPVFKQSYWEQYVRVNQKFADAVMEEIGDSKAFIWIQDYHFCLLPKMLREISAANQLIMAHFWHIPWPSYEAFRICPHKNEILDGMLANDMIGFHTHYHCNNFLEVVDRQLESKIDRERFSVIRHDHETLVRPYPISVDFDDIDRRSRIDFDQIACDLTREFGLGDCQLLLGVDRIDYTKGIPERLLAIDRLLEKCPDLKERIVLLQVGILSRIQNARYQAINNEISELAARINDKHSTHRWKPIILFKGNLPSSKLPALYRMARVCLVSALHDGMNLVSKEFIAAHSDGDGVLVLSQFTGSAREMTEAVLINPYDSEQFADSIYLALTMGEEERRRRMTKLRQAVRTNNIFHWAGKFLSGLLKIEFKEQPEEVMV